MTVPFFLQTLAGRIRLVSGRVMLYPTGMNIHELLEYAVTTRAFICAPGILEDLPALLKEFMLDSVSIEDQLPAHAGDGESRYLLAADVNTWGRSRKQSR